MYRLYGCRVAAASAIGISFYQKYRNEVIAKEEPKTKVHGFDGLPDSHSLVIYLKWKNIDHEVIQVNPIDVQAAFDDSDCDAKTPFDLPVLEKDGIYVSGSTLSISILETQENFANNNELLSLAELKQRFPKMKIAWQTLESARNKFLYTQEKVMNRCWTLHPIQDKLDEHMDKETLKFHKVTKRANEARTIADEELKPLLIHCLHLDYSQSFRNASKFFDAVPVPFYSKHLTIASYAHARKSNFSDYLSARRKENQNSRKEDTLGAVSGTLMGFDKECIWTDIAEKIAKLGPGSLVVNRA